MHPWQHANKAYHNNIVSIRRVASEVSGVDDGVGTILETLKKNGLDENTLVVFAGDQGWMGGQNGFFGMGDHTRPIAAHDLMMQIPFIFRQPGSVKPGTQRYYCQQLRFSSQRAGTYGLKNRIPTNTGITWPEFCTSAEG